MVNIDRLRNALGEASDSIPIEVYNKLVIDIAEALSITDLERLDFAMSCGVVATEIYDRLPPREYSGN